MVADFFQGVVALAATTAAAAAVAAVAAVVATDTVDAIASPPMVDDSSATCQNKSAPSAKRSTVDVSPGGVHETVPCMRVSSCFLLLVLAAGVALAIDSTTTTTTLVTCSLSGLARAENLYSAAQD